MMANNAKERISPMQMVNLLWGKKFRLPFMFLAMLFVFIGSSGFSYIAFNSVNIFEVSRLIYLKDASIYILM